MKAKENLSAAELADEKAAEKTKETAADKVADAKKAAPKNDSDIKEENFSPNKSKQLPDKLSNENSSNIESAVRASNSENVTTAKVFAKNESKKQTLKRKATKNIFVNNPDDKIKWATELVMASFYSPRTGSGGLGGFYSRGRRIADFLPF